MSQSKQMPYVCLYVDNLELLENLSVQSVGRLSLALLHYLKNGEEPVLKGNERYVWPFLRNKLIRDQKAYAERCERNRKNGQKGGRPKKQFQEEAP